MPDIFDLKSKEEIKIREHVAGRNVVREKRLQGETSYFGKYHHLL